MGDEMRAVAAAPARVVDTLGAGDGFIAGFLVAHLGGAALDAALAAGAQAAGEVCGWRGAFGHARPWRVAAAGGSRVISLQGWNSFRLFCPGANFSQPPWPAVPRGSAATGMAMAPETGCRASALAARRGSPRIC
ncbi:MAG: PfkB family carbohydrate kinase [Alphaproteobacteria bacterium]